MKTQPQSEISRASGQCTTIFQSSYEHVTLEINLTEPSIIFPILITWKLDMLIHVTVHGPKTLFFIA